ncbi:MAG: hypothetical protein ACE5IR_07990 [bacterium]
MGKQLVMLRLLLTLVVFAAIVVVWLAPAERSLGHGMKTVYIHVTFIWAGMLGFVAAGFVGLLAIFKPRPELMLWLKNISWVAFGWFAAGTATSVLAAKVNWGAMNWGEPRLQSSLQFLAVALLVLTIYGFLKNDRVGGGLSTLLAFFMMWQILGAPLVLHPDSPIRLSDSSAIQMTFLTMFMLNCLGVALIVAMVHSKNTEKQ